MSTERNEVGTIAVIGAGTIGQALISGLVKSGVDPDTIVATNRNPDHSAEIARRFSVRTTSDNAEAVSGAAMCFICVKPDQVLDVIAEVSDTVAGQDESTALISMAAGVTLEAMEGAVSAAGTPLIRVMPNTPMLVGKGVHIVSFGRYADEECRRQVLGVLQATGSVVEVPEKLIDAATAVSGCGPAYFYLLAEALVDAGVTLGLPRDVAGSLAAATAAGAGEMMAGGASPATLRHDVSSPAGSTGIAVRELEESGLRGAVYRAAEAAARRSAELG